VALIRITAMPTRRYLSHTFDKLKSKTANQEMPKVVGEAKEEVAGPLLAQASARALPRSRAKSVAVATGAPKSPAAPSIVQKQVEALEAKVDTLGTDVSALDRKMDAMQRSIEGTMSEIKGMLKASASSLAP
jgi:predicted RNase H-like nuclease (RuvC/YqgF family)